MNRLPRRRFVLFLVPFICCAFFIAGGTFLHRFYSHVVAVILSASVDQDFRVGRVSFSPFTGVRLGDVVFMKDDMPVMTITSLTLGFLFRDLAHRRLVLQDVRADGVRVLTDEKHPISSDAFFYSSASARQPHGGFEIILNQATYCFTDVHIVLPGAYSQGEESLVINVCFALQQNKIESTGDISYFRSTGGVKGMERVEVLNGVQFSVDLEPIGTDMAVNHIQIRRGPYIFSGTGIVHDYRTEPQLDIRVYMDSLPATAIAALSALSPHSGEVGGLAHVTGVHRNVVCRAEFFSPIIEFAANGEYFSVERLKSTVRYDLAASKIHLEEARFIFDGSTNVNIRGHVHNIFSPRFDIVAEFMPLALPSGTAESPQPVRVEIKGVPRGPQFVGGIHLMFFPDRNRQYTLSLLDLSFFSDSTRPESNILAAQSIRVLEQAGEGKHLLLQEFNFDNAQARVVVAGKGLKIEAARMDGYGGYASVQGELRFRPGRADYFFGIHLDELNISDITMAYPLSCRMGGVFNGDIILQNRKADRVRGSIVARDFHLSGLAPIDSVADFIGIQSIKHIDSAQAAYGFDVTKEGSAINQFDIDAPGMRLRSYFDVNKNGWLEGSVAFSLPRKILEESKIFRTLLAIAREREDLVDFVARISGFTPSLRTELVTSDFRDKLKERVSTRIQRYIEDEINRALGGQ